MGALYTVGPFLASQTGREVVGTVMKSHGSLLFRTVPTTSQLVCEAENGPTAHEAPIIVLISSSALFRQIERYGETLTYTNMVRGALVLYKQRDVGAGERGAHIRHVPSTASAEAAQRVLQPPRDARAARRQAPGAAAAVRRAALAAPSASGGAIRPPEGAKTRLDRDLLRAGPTSFQFLPEGERDEA